MATFFFILQLSLLVVNLALGVMVGYLMFLTVAARRAKKHTPLAGRTPQRRFMIVIPAHNEEKLLPELLGSLSRLDYPPALYSVHVIADNCADRTAVVAERSGAAVHVRMDETLRGKGYALQWFLQQASSLGIAYDSVLILDADSSVSPNFLQVMDARLAAGDRVVQAYYSVKDPDRSFSIALRYAALSVLHYLRPLGRTAFGGSVGLKGNGMVFDAKLLRDHEWSAALTEDIEFHMNLILSGERVAFAPDAVVWAEMPASLSGAQTQNARWEMGRLQMARRYAPQLLAAARQEARRGEWRRAWLFVDALMEHVILPFALLVAASVAAFVLSVILLGLDLVMAGDQSLASHGLAVVNVLLSGGAVLGQIVYLFAGLRLAQSPRAVYRSLLYAPVYVVWKLAQVARLLAGKEQESWVRTARNKA